ncbi:ATP-dependent helicase [Serratia proteamaculans]|uniref:UvrD-helicase domain-containing protein n=1 Tax=Serratia proteamaculans TaxID=28151 RepID=UPI0010760F41|nr:ATP-dependent helicase [Serratia proteamaculans]TFZ53244.1 ATP-dependent helicase [Serratia proteamaculans]
MINVNNMVWKPDDFIVKTDELKDIIFDQSSLSILAGPGAGKTEMLAQKSVFLLDNGLCPWPKKILFLTFKTEASKNVNDRVVKRSINSRDRFASRTYHSFAKSIVDRYRMSLDEEIRPDIGYDIIFKGGSSKDKVNINDIIPFALKILKKNKEIVNLFRESYSHVFMDEFQDTTSLQYELISTIFLGTTTKVICVGDLNQSIMLWANADPEIYKRVEKDFRPERKLLVSNFRADESIKKFLDVFLPFVVEGTFSLSRAEPNNSCVLHSFTDDIQEADFLSGYISNKVNSGYLLKEICVLTKQKSADYTKKLCERLNSKNINNIVYDSFQDAISEPLGIIFSLILECILIRSPKAWSEFIELYQELHEIDLKNDKDQYKLQEFSDYFSIIKKGINYHDVNELVKLIHVIIKKMDFKKIKSKWPQYKSKKHVEFIWKELTNQLNSIFPFAQTRESLVERFSGSNSVQIMNIHKCKGLEYKLVILLGFEDDAFWSYSDKLFEQRCVLYVAFTRAKEEILVTQSSARSCISSGQKTLTTKKIDSVANFMVNICGMKFTQH